MQRILLLSLLFVAIASPDVYGQQRSDGFHKCPEDSDWSGHFVDGVQVGALKHSTGDYFAYDRYADAWTRSAVSPRLLRSPGLLGNRRDHGEGWFLGGQPVGQWEAKGWLEGNAQVPEDTSKPSLTVIGPQPARELVARDLANDPALRVIVPQFVTQFYDPHDAMIVASGHQRGGQPTIYAQSPKGEVLLRDDKYHGPAVLSAALHRVLELQDEQRRPNPDYSPLLDPSSAQLLKPTIGLPSVWSIVGIAFLIIVALVSVCVVLFVGILSAYLTFALGKRLYQWAAPMPPKGRK